MYLANVVAAEPRNLMARQLLAEARLRQQKSNDALEALLPVLDDPGASAQLLALAGRASLSAGDSATGLQLLQRGAKSEPGNLGVQLELVAGYITTGELDQARALLESLPSCSNRAGSRKPTSTSSAPTSSPPIHRRRW